MTTSLFDCAEAPAPHSFQNIQNCLTFSHRSSNFQTICLKSRNFQTILSASRTFSDKTTEFLLKFNNLPIDKFQKMCYNIIIK